MPAHMMSDSGAKPSPSTPSYSMPPVADKGSVVARLRPQRRMSKPRCASCAAAAQPPSPAPMIAMLLIGGTAIIRCDSYKEPAETPAKCALFVRDQETPVRIGVRGGGSGIRTAFEAPRVSARISKTYELTNVSDSTFYLVAREPDTRCSDGKLELQSQRTSSV